jgi:type IV pilus assembly protein PilY1
VLPGSSLAGWFMNLNASGQGEQVVTSALIAGGMVTFSTNRPIPPQVGTCSTTLGEARGYWVNLLNAAGAIGTPGACGGTRSSPFVGGGLPPSPVLANGVPVDGKATTVVIGAVQKGSNGAGGASVAISPQKIRPPVRSKRTRTYSYTSGD